jgi:hypothetical protein
MESHLGGTWRGACLPVLVVCLLVGGGCDYLPNYGGGPLFERVAPSTTNIRFSNDLTYNNSFNIYTYRNFYAGGGVALGDVNGDGLLDIYLTANQKSNRLYLNRGDFTFEDVTEEAGVGGQMPWSTGASMADVNGDGLLDIYVANGRMSFLSTMETAPLRSAPRSSGLRTSATRFIPPSSTTTTTETSTCLSSTTTRLSPSISTT